MLAKAGEGSDWTRMASKCPNICTHPHKKENSIGNKYQKRSNIIVELKYSKPLDVKFC